MDTEGIEIYDTTFLRDTHKINLDNQKIYSLFVKKGVLSYGGVDLEQGAFIKIEKESEFNFRSKSGLEIFEIRSPLRPSYSTYYERFN
jgi:hypothetical protein